jgi:hypothetical protein
MILNFFYEAKLPTKIITILEINMNHGLNYIETKIRCNQNMTSIYRDLTQTLCQR